MMREQTLVFHIWSSFEAGVLFANKQVKHDVFTLENIDLMKNRILDTDAALTLTYLDKFLLCKEIVSMYILTVKSISLLEFTNPARG